MENSISNIDRHLGKQSNYSQQYDPSLLVAIPRSENREKYNITDYDLTGFDYWNAYEVSFLLYDGIPAVGVLVIKYPSNSKFIVESKSLKLYLNSFNMTKFDFVDFESAVQDVTNKIIWDLEEIIGTDVEAQLYGHDEYTSMPFYDMWEDYVIDIPTENMAVLEERLIPSNFKLLSFEKEDPSLLQLGSLEGEFMLKTHLLRSNCRVTHQPDWGDLYIYIKTGERGFDGYSLLPYILSFRQESHFHEEVVEMIFKRILDTFEPEELMVGAQYTRRGGIDINPFRATHSKLLPDLDVDSWLLKKNYRQ